MDIGVIFVVAIIVIVLGWSWAAFSLRKHFAQQKQFLIDLKRRHEEHRLAALQRQQEIEKVWAGHYAKEQAKRKVAEEAITLRAPVENVNQINHITNIQER